MSHLEDKLAEFVFEELTESEMEATRQHVAQCVRVPGSSDWIQKGSALA